MARGVASPIPAPLPKVSFVKVEDKSLSEPAGVHDVQARSFGYNDFSEFHRPEHYIRYIEPLEHELAVQVEYDMDEQDHEWLDSVNADRKKEQLDKVSYETFEIIMDRLEKEWFDLTKTLPKSDMAMPSEDSTCAICDDSEGENTNAIVFCDGCNLAVHQDCYGVPYIPEGQWLCRKCTVSPETPVSCILCPNEGGAFKQTVHGEWVHLLCAIWVPETRVVNEVFMEPITGIDRISKQRWRLKCSICDVREGACIQCAKSSCFLAFHPTCARKEKLLMPMKAAHGSDAPSLTCFCERHLPKEQQDARLEALEAEREATPQNESAKTARAYATTYTSGPPLVPALVVDRIMQYINKVIVRKKLDFVLMVCKYWSLKREGRRGAPLLKRLHLEPWTASNAATAGGRGSEEDKVLKLEYIKKLRQDLESVRMIAELTRKRETKKLEQAQIIQDVLSKCLYPHESRLRYVFERIITSDRHEYFKNPVSKTEVPDYFEVVKCPMCWNYIDSKLDRHEYWDIQSFKDDILLVLDNAIFYNKSDTPFYKSAYRIRTLARNILIELDSLVFLPQFPNAPEATSVIDEAITENKPQTASTFANLATLGSLEPRMDVLEVLVSLNAIKDDKELEYILDNVEPIVSLFKYEFGRLRPPPLKKAKGKKKQKSRKSARQDNERADTDILDLSPGFRAPRTRRATAAASAFEAEIGNLEAGPSTLTEMEEHDGTDRRTPKKARRILPTLPGQSTVPQMVENIDNQQSFKMFDAGWILPPDQKRGGRTRTERPLPPKKRPKTDKSQLSVLSTGVEENETLRDKDLVEEMEDHAPLPPSSSPSPPPPQLSNVETPKPKGKEKIIGPVVIIEELDTPATRREKSLRKKAEHAARLAAEASVAQKAEYEGDNQDSDSSSLSEVESEEEEGDRKNTPSRSKHSRAALLTNMSSKAAPNKGRSAALPDIEPGTIILGSGEKLESGTLVWAKADTFPWWAAVVFDDDVAGIPKRILNIKHTKNEHLVRFYDRNNSWQWLDLNRLKLLGEDKSLDEDMLANSSKRQKWRNPNMRYECRNSYRRAIAEMETTGEAEEKDGSSIAISGGLNDQTAGEDPVPPSESDKGVSVWDGMKQNETEELPSAEDVIMQEADHLSDSSELSDLPEP